MKNFNNSSNIVIKLAVVFLIIFTAGCDKLLDDQKPVSGLTFGNAIETQADVEAALEAVYNRMVFALGEGSNAYYTTDLLGDETAPRLTTYGDMRAGRAYWGDFGVFGGGDATSFFDDAISPTDGAVNWQPFYIVANMANIVLAETDNVSIADAAKSRIQGEAYFMRALAYWYLLRLWGDVPIIDFAYNSAGQDFFPAQSSKEDVADFIAADLDRAEPLLANAPFSRVKASTGAVQALRAHLFAWKGLVLGGGNADLQIAADEALALINNSNYELLDNYADVFYGGYQTDESIFELFADPGTLQTNLFVWGKDPVIAGRPRGIVEFDEDDLDYFTNTPEDLRIPTLKNEPRPGDLIQAAYVSKFLGKNGTSLPSDQADHIILFRLADIILLRAEVLNELGQTSQAILLLDEIRDRAGLTGTSATTQEEVKEAIFFDRRLELMAEGHLWFDLIRFDKAMDLPTITDPNEIYLPVLQQELDNNPNLVQNPAY